MMDESASRRGAAPQGSDAVVSREELVESHDAWMHDCKLAWADMREVAAELDKLWAEFDTSSPLSDKLYALVDRLHANSTDHRHAPPPTFVVELTEYERNAAANALSKAGSLNPRADQRTADDRAYYKLVHALPKKDQA